MSRRRLPTLSVWDGPAVEKAFAEAGVKPAHAARMWK